MSENEAPRRRRRQIPQTEQTQEPRRIVISHEEEEPDWMVSADEVSGAAYRRTGERPAPRREQTASHSEQTAPRSAQELPRAQAAPSAPRKQTANRAPSAGRRKPMSKKAKARRAAKTRRIVLGSLLGALLLLLIVVAVIGGGRLIDIKQTLDGGSRTFYPNIFVNGIPLSGMTLDQAEEVVTQQVSSQIAAFKITLRTQDGSGRTWDITGRDLKMQYDVADQLDQLWSIGHTGSASTRYEQVKALEQEPAMRYTTLTYDLSCVNQILMQIKQEVDRSPVSATRINDETKWPPYSYTDDMSGQELDITGLNEHIMGMVERLESGVVDLAPTPVQAPLTRAQLEGQITLLASYETSISKAGDYAEARHENIRIGTEKFDKLIIRSGESVSFNKVAGKRTASNGYQPALELAYGEYVEGYGGGICQVSSTLYNAVVNAGLEVKNRYQHSLASSYVPLGLDATVQDDRLDFVFKNNTSSDIFISASYYQGKDKYWRCKFTIHGRPDPNGYTYKLESEVREEIPIPEPTYIPDKHAEHVVYDDEMKQTSEGAVGHIVDVYLVTTDSSGVAFSRELQYTDTYKAQTPKYYIGVTPRETPEPFILFE